MDIRPLAEYFLRTSTVCPDKAGRITSLTEMAIEAIEKHTWPGNIRELRNVIDRAIMLETTDKIGLSSIFIESEDQLILDFDAGTQNCASCLEKSSSGMLRRTPRYSMPERVENRASRHRRGDFSLDKAERELIARALQESGWQKTRAAALLGITRATLYAKVKQHNIQRGTYIPKLDQPALN